MTVTPAIPTPFTSGGSWGWAYAAAPAPIYNQQIRLMMSARIRSSRAGRSKAADARRVVGRLKDVVVHPHAEIWIRRMDHIPCAVAVQVADQYANVIDPPAALNVEEDQIAGLKLARCSRTHIRPLAASTLRDHNPDL